MSPDDPLRPFRHGITFAFFNALTWQVGIGTPMVLLAERLGASPFQVGLAYSFVFLLTPIQLLSSALLPGHGFKRVMLAGWGTRSFFLSVPIVLTIMAPETGRPWMVHLLVASVFLFCAFRAVGAAAIIPWLYMILPRGTHGRYFANDQYASGIAGVGILLVCALTFAVLPLYTAFTVQYLLAMLGSALSYVALSRLPDARPVESIHLLKVLRETPGHLVRPGPFRSFLWLAVAFSLVVNPIPPFGAYYLRTGAGLSQAQILMFTTLQYIGVIIGAAFMRMRIDHTGARPFLHLSMSVYMGVAVLWLAFLQFGWWAEFLLPAAYLATGVAASFWFSANLNYLPKTTADSERTFLAAVYGSATAFLSGLSPLFWGRLLESGGATHGINIPVFKMFFLSVIVCGLVLHLFIARLKEAGAGATAPILLGAFAFRPFRAASYLAGFLAMGSSARRDNGTKP